MFCGGDTTMAGMLADLAAVEKIWGPADAMALLQGYDSSAGLPCTTCDTWAFAINKHPTPEPRTLVMRGTRLLGLAGLIRRKLNL